MIPIFRALIFQGVINKIETFVEQNFETLKSRFPLLSNTAVHITGLQGIGIASGEFKGSAKAYMKLLLKAYSKLDSKLELNKQIVVRLENFDSDVKGFNTNKPKPEIPKEETVQEKGKLPDPV